MAGAMPVGSVSQVTQDDVNSGGLFCLDDENAAWTSSSDDDADAGGLFCWDLDAALDLDGSGDAGGLCFSGNTAAPSSSDDDVDAGGLFCWDLNAALDLDGSGDAGGLCFSGNTAAPSSSDDDVDAGGLFCSDVDAAASNLAFSFTSKSHWMILTALMPVLVKSGCAYHCREVFSLCARTRRRIARSSSLQRSSINVVIIFRISTNAIRPPRSTAHFLIKA